MKSTQRTGVWRSRALAGVLVFVAALLFTSGVQAKVRLVGAWPDRSKAVDLELSEVTRRDAMRALAKEMGWSLVLQVPLRGHVDLYLHHQPSDKVMGAILSDGAYVATRDGDLVRISTEQSDAGVGGDAQEAGESQTGLPTDAGVAAKERDSGQPRGETVGAGGPPKVRGADRTITGGSVVIKKGEVVHDVTVMGGDADVFGTVTGDIVVFGGRALVHKGAVIWGDATTIGGSLTVQDGARVVGEVGVVGGVLHKGKDTRIGDVSERGGKSRHAHGWHVKPPKSGGLSGPWTLARVLKEVGAVAARAAMLFLLGVVLLYLAPKRLETLRTELRLRPLQAFGWGMLGFVVVPLLVVALSVTVIGIPVALVVALAAILFDVAGFVVVLWVVGSLGARSRTDNVYLHLAVGVGLYAAASLLPYLGTLLSTLAMVMGMGLVITTRGAGLFSRAPASDG